MKVSTFRKEITVVGNHQTLEGFLKVSLNEREAYTNRFIAVVEAYTDKVLFKRLELVQDEYVILRTVSEITSELCQLLIKLANEKPVKTLEDKLLENGFLKIK